MAGLQKRFVAVSILCKKFEFLWKFLEENYDYKISSEAFCESYSVDVCKDLSDEIETLKLIYHENIGSKIIQPFQLLNKLHEISLQNLFPNLIVALRIFVVFQLQLQVLKDHSVF